MNILCGIDDAYTKHCAVMLNSLFLNTPGKGFRVYVLNQALSATSKRRLQFICNKHGHELIPVLVDEDALSSLPPTLEHLSVATYLRLLVTRLLPEELSRILYLDADLIVRNDLTPFYELDLGDHYIGAVAQPPEPERNERLKMRPGSTYFNAGVLMINMDVWRAEQVGENAMRFATENPEAIQVCDQDALNAVSDQRVLVCPSKWNAGEWVFHDACFSIPGMSEDDVREARENPAIAHYTGSDKPWIGGKFHRFSHEYFVYLKKTPYFGRQHQMQRLRSKGLDLFRVFVGKGTRRQS